MKFGWQGGKMRELGPTKVPPGGGTGVDYE